MAPQRKSTVFKTFKDMDFQTPFNTLANKVLPGQYSYFHKTVKDSIQKAVESWLKEKLGDAAVKCTVTRRNRYGATTVPAIPDLLREEYEEWLPLIADDINKAFVTERFHPKSSNLATAALGKRRGDETPIPDNETTVAVKALTTSPKLRTRLGNGTPLPRSEPNLRKRRGNDTPMPESDIALTERTINRTMKPVVTLTKNVASTPALQSASKPLAQSADAFTQSIPQTPIFFERLENDVKKRQDTFHVELKQMVLTSLESNRVSMRNLVVDLFNDQNEQRRLERLEANVRFPSQDRQEWSRPVQHERGRWGAHNRGRGRGHNIQQARQPWNWRQDDRRRIRSRSRSFSRSPSRSRSRSMSRSQSRPRNFSRSPDRKRARFPQEVRPVNQNTRVVVNERVTVAGVNPNDTGDVSNRAPLVASQPTQPTATIANNHPHNPFNNVSIHDAPKADMAVVEAFLQQFASDSSVLPELPATCGTRASPWV